MVALAGALGPGDERTHAIGPDHDTGLLLHASTTWKPTPDARHTVAVPEDLLDQEAFAGLGTCRHRSIQENLIQDGAPWSIDRRDTLDRRGHATEREWAEVEAPGGKGWRL